MTSSPRCTLTLSTALTVFHRYTSTGCPTKGTRCPVPACLHLSYLSRLPHLSTMFLRPVSRLVVPHLSTVFPRSVSHLVVPHLSTMSPWPVSHLVVLHLSTMFPRPVSHLVVPHLSTVFPRSVSSPIHQHHTVCGPRSQTHKPRQLESKKATSEMTLLNVTS